MMAIGQFFMFMSGSFFENIDRNPDAYRGIMTPTLLLTGEEDRAIPNWQQQKLLDILPNIRQVMLPGSGHMTYMERPDIFWPTVKAFMAAKSIDFEIEGETAPTTSGIDT